MNNINYNKYFLDLINESKDFGDTTNISKNLLKFIDIVGSKIERQKGVWTVLVTLIVYKTIHKKQDIRYHQSNMEGGFSGRSFDTNHITPLLKEMGFPSMSESGWLTRSLEQPYPYTLKYNGHISDTSVKKSFLNIIDYVQKYPDSSKQILLILLNWGWKIKEKNTVEIQPLENSESIRIINIIKILDNYFEKHYTMSGGSKLPVICFYSIYQILVQQIYRYRGTVLKPLGYHTTSDKTSKSSGDIEIINRLDNTVFESMEIKYNIEISSHIVNRVIEKIKVFNPQRYYVLSTVGIKETEEEEIVSKVIEIKEKHGCEIILNGVLDTLKYYLRLIDNLTEFINIFSDNISKDSELKSIHKEEWKKILDELKH